MEHVQDGKPNAGREITNYAVVKLPYSTVETTKVGDLVLSGTAVDSSAIYTGSLPVYTTGALKLISIETVTPANSPARAAYSVTKGGTIKLTFNKPVGVATDQTFTLGTYTAYHKVEGNNIFVWVDEVFTSAVTLTYPAIYSSADTSDAITGGSITGISSEDGRQLILIGTNLYDNPNGLTVATPGLKNNFALDGNIELEFGNIPSGSTVKAELWADGTPDVLVYTTAAINGNTVTITPAANLKANTTYGVKALIENGGIAIWKTPTSATSLVSIANIGPVASPTASIQFQTISTLAIQTIGTGSKTNVNVTGAATTSFDANSDIYLDFDRPLTALGANAAKLIYTATGKETPVAVTLEGAGRILKISPSRLLAPSAGFTLKLNVESVDGQKYARDSDLNDNSDDYATTTDYNTNISFTTASTVRWGSDLKPTETASLAVVTTPVPKTNTTVTLRLSGLTASLVARSFDVYRTIYNSTSPGVLTPAVSVTKGTITAADFSKDLALTADYLDDENQVFYIRGVDDFGQVIAAQVGPIDFTP